MKARDLIAETGSALKANKGKSALTILGIVIGITAVITMTSLVGGIRDALVSEMGMNAARAISIYPYNGAGVSDDQLAAMREQLPDYEYLSPSNYGSAQEIATPTTTEKLSASITGVDEHYFDVSGLKIAQGRAFTQGESAEGSMSVILDSQAVQKLFSSADANPVGKIVTLDGTEATVVGVVENSALMGGGGGNGSLNIYMPVSAVSLRFASSGTGYQQIFGLAK
jgi:putative ABC transport system permease protein